ncbi:unnamed protein product [Brassica rapa]|uniref:Uncharacterized protein n=1 Tax=Brassica campestris TaxID=3711 RepID=A0A3P6AVL6_BRACM|nr:unnamed protein product [Brassica rapa]VDC88138.1 unnamed protein product [Brassica rapa]
MDGHFHLTFGKKTLLNKEVVDKAVRFSNKKDASGDEDDPGRPTSNGVEPSTRERRGHVAEMTADLAGEAQLSVNERDRPQQGVRIRREEGKHGRKPSLVKYGDCNRREIRRLGEPPENVRSDGTRSVKRSTRSENWRRRWKQNRDKEDEESQSGGPDAGGQRPHQHQEAADARESR